jgi:hypothetical protein
VKKRFWTLPRSRYVKFRRLVVQAHHPIVKGHHVSPCDSAPYPALPWHVDAQSHDWNGETQRRPAQNPPPPT